MVGIPGKSTGCITCRRRKVKCDAQKPACQRCTASGRPCEGYEKFPVFLNNTQQGRMKRRPLEEARPMSIPNTRLPPPENNAGDQSIHSRSPSQDFVRAQNALPPAMDSEKMANTALLARFIDQYLPQPEPDRRQYRHHWLNQASSICMPGSMLDMALRSLAWSRAGFSLGDTAFTARSRIFYGRALTLIRRALLDPELVKQDDTVAACRALSIYELYESTTESTNGFHMHTLGLCKIAEVRGAKEHNTPFSRAMLQDTIWGAMIFALTQRHSMFLADEEWMAQLRENPHFQSEVPLMELGFGLAAILERFDKVNALTDPFEKDFQLAVILVDLEDLAQRLSDWEATTTAPDGGPLYHLDQPLPIPRPGQAWSSHLTVSFPDLKTATMVTRSWSIKTIMLMTRLSILSNLDPSLLSFGKAAPAVATTPHPPFPSPISTRDQAELRDQAVHVATVITRAAPYMTRSDLGFAAAQNMILPLRAATFVLMAFRGEETRRCLAAFRMLSHGKGIGWAKVIGRSSGGYRIEGEELVVPEGEEGPGPGLVAKRTC